MNTAVETTLRVAGAILMVVTAVGFVAQTIVTFDLPWYVALPILFVLGALVYVIGSRRVGIA